MECLTLLVLFSITPLYTGLSTILIQRQIPDLLESKVHGEDSEPEFADTFYKTQYEMLKSRSLAAHVIRDLALDQNPLFTGIRKSRRFFGYFLSGEAHVLASRPPASRITCRGDSGRRTVEYRSLSATVNNTTACQYSIGFGCVLESGSGSSRRSYQCPHPCIHSKRLRTARSERRRCRAVSEGKLDELESRIEKSEAALNKYRQERGILGLFSRRQRPDD